MRCCVSGCTREAVGYGKLCETHRTRKRRHGAPDQTPIRKADLKPYIAEVERWIAKNPESRTWVIAQQRWEGFLAQAKTIEGTSIHGPTKRAAEEVQRVGASVDPRRVIVTVLALCLMREHQPATFRTEEALRLAAARRVRSLSPLSVGQWQNGPDSRVKKSLREMPPNVVSIIGAWLIEVLGGAGIYLAQRQRRDADKKQQEAAELSECLRDLDLG